MLRKWDLQGQIPLRRMLLRFRAQLPETRGGCRVGIVGSLEGFL